MSLSINPDLPLLPDLPAGREIVLRLVKPVAELVIRGYWNVKVHGAEHVPTSGPVLLAANHIGYLDGPVLVAVNRRRSYVLAKKEIFAGILGQLLNQIGQIPINRAGVD